MKILLTESQYQLLTETVILKNVEFNDYAKLVAKVYEDAPINDSAAHSAYNALNSSNYILWQRLLSKVNVHFVSEFENEIGKKIKIGNKTYEVTLSPQPYDTATEMASEFKKTGVLNISIDYSNHPYFSVIDNIVFRTVHDYIVHILGNKPFGLKGEIQSYNLHAKLVPFAAKSAIFTEVVGQVCSAIINGGFPEQKCAILKGFDYDKIGKVEPWVLEKYGEN